MSISPVVDITNTIVAFCKKHNLPKGEAADLLYDIRYYLGWDHNKSAEDAE